MKGTKDTMETSTYMILAITVSLSPPPLPPSSFPHPLVSLQVYVYLPVEARGGCWNSF